MENKTFGKILLLFSFLVLLFSLVAVYGFLDLNKLSIFINSDTVSSYLIYRDIFKNGGDLHGWVMAAAPTFFPDLTLYMLLAFIFPASALITPFIYSIVQVTIICLLLIYIFRKSTPSEYHRFDFLIPLFFSCIFLESYYFSTDASFGFFLCVPSYHCGAFVNTLIALALYLSGFKMNIKLILFFIATVIGGFSDLLFLVMFTAPFTLTMIFRIQKSNLKFQLFFIITSLIGSFIGIKIYHYIKDSGLFIFTNPHRIYDFNNIKPSLDLYMQQISGYVKVFGFRSFAIVFTILASMVLLLVSIFSKHKKEKIYFIFLFFAFFTFSVLPAPIINGNYTGFDTIRYNTHPFYLSFFIVSILVAMLFNNYFHAKYTLLSALVLFAFIIALIWKVPSMNLNGYFGYYPKDVAQIDSVCKKYNLNRGVGEYWLAKKATALSKNNIEVLTVYPEGNMSEFGSNLNWYYEGSFNFIVSNGYSKEVLDKHFKIKDTIKITDYDILIVEDFYYKKGEYFPSPLKQ